MDPELGLVEEARKGSEEAFTRILRNHQAHVRGYLGGFVRKQEVVDDLAQETFLTALRSLDTFKEESSLRIWLLGIARHRALNYLRAEQSRRSREGNTLRSAVERWMAQDAGSPEGEPAGQARELTALEECIERLPPASSTIVTEYYLQGRSTTDIARRSGKKEGAIWKTLSRIRLALRQCIEMRLNASGAKS